MTGIRERIGVDIGRRLPIEDAVAWAANNDVHYFDLQIDADPKGMASFDEARCAPIREACAKHGIHLGLHTMSAVNTAEYAPLVAEGVDAYLRSYVDAYTKLNAEWIVVHAGFHFSSELERRKEAGLERLKRMVGYAEEKGALILLENLNWEPDLAEVHYLAHNVEECVYYFERLKSPNFGWSFTVNHATLVPEGIAGFLEGVPTELMREVRLADNNGEYELHMYPGEGIIDFTDMFRRIEATGFTGHYMNAFGSLDDRLSGRDYLADKFPS